MRIINVFFIVIFSILSISLFGQDKASVKKVRRIAIGIKAGVPIGVGGSAEIVVPVLHNRLAAYLDYADIKERDIEDVTVSHKHLDYGANLYLMTKGKGLYLSIGKSQSTTDFAYVDEVSDSGNTYVGVANGSLDLNMTNFKLGFKLGGLLFAKLEAGYGFGDIPQQILISGTTEAMGMELMETSLEDIPDIPGWNENGMIIGSLTIGIAF